MIKKEKCCPPSIAYANSADAPYIPSPKGRGFTAHFDKKAHKNPRSQMMSDYIIRDRGFFMT